MQQLKRTLTGLVIGGALFGAAPLALADSYFRGHHDNAVRYHAPGKSFQRQHHRGHHVHRPPVTVIHKHYYQEPRVRERIIYRDRPVLRERVIVKSSPYHSSVGGEVYRHEYRSATPMILGGIIGGLAGNQIGEGRGKRIATVAGMVLGGSIGRDMEHR